ncbi:MAG: NAD-binding protein, partial [Coriobacteriales bacterium]
MYIIINGGGKIGSYLATTLIDNGHNVAIIEINPATAARLTKDLPP